MQEWVSSAIWRIYHRVHEILDIILVKRKSTSDYYHCHRENKSDAHYLCIFKTGLRVIKSTMGKKNQFVNVMKIGDYMMEKEEFKI